MEDAKSHKTSSSQKTEINIEKNKGYFIIKRFIDFFGSLIGGILISPFLLIVAIIIKCTSKGPVFFVQERVGLNGKTFKMYKFRSMVVNAEELLESLKDKNEMSGPMFKMKNDPRVTKVGKFIRKTSIDEFPQLINVIKGEMSLVGPRPNLPKEVEQFNDYHKLKLKARPGMTCFWQVMGRSSLTFEEWMELDLKYMRERSTWVDIKLIFKTIFLIFGDDNAR